MKPNIGIKPEFLKMVAHSLSKIMADEFVLYTKTLRAHWCVTGPDFHSKHLYPEGIYGQMADICDDLAERTFMAEQRVKEIGIRKVLGASVFALWQLLTKDFAAGAYFSIYCLACSLLFYVQLAA